uniref:DNA repair protein complementing XP-C cells homolog isoform X2 n=1 Tax=Styela clava TaxID=7725 RepID=UPI001939AAC9|nr:DNA repair protein complementing XP-C cells homolog isoform X2 [Styela clava]
MSPDTTTESSDEEWEEVEESQKYEEEEEEKDVVPSANVEVEWVPDAVKKKLKREKWDREMVETCIRQAAKRIDKEMQTVMHKVHLMCLLTMGMRVNRICNNEELLSRTYSLLPKKYHDVKPKHVSAMFLTRFIQDMKKIFETENGVEKLLGFGMLRLPFLETKMKKALEAQKVKFKLDWVLVFVLALRAMGLNTRLVVSLQPLPLKTPIEKRDESVAAIKSKIYASKKNKTKDIPLLMDKDSKVILQLDGANDSPQKRRVTRSSTAGVKVNNEESVNPVKARKRKIAKKDSDEENAAPLKTRRSKLNKVEEKITEVSTAVAKKEVTKKLRKSKKDTTAVQESETKKENASKQKVNKVDETPLVKQLTNTKAKRKLRTTVKRKINVKSDVDSDNEDADFQPVVNSPSSSENDSDFEPKMETKKSPAKKSRSNVQGNTTKKTSAGKAKTKKVTSRKTSAAKRTVSSADCYDQWIEVFSEEEGKWICLDVFRCIINHPEEIEKYSTPPVHYVLGFSNKDYIKDITPRYAAKWLTDTRKLRVGMVDKDWWKETLAPYAERDTVLDAKENRDMQEALLAQPLPTTISALKNHPLFGLRRHLLKYEAIYPPDVPAVGLIRGEEIYPRSSIYTLCSREKWLQEARSVKDGEEPYKMVASLWINMKLKQDMSTLSMPLFGIWQTEPYVPPTAKNGKVPKNQFGNVDLFQPEMLPIGCVQLRLPGLNKVARKLDIDVALAVIGFDTHNGYPHTVTDGYIACIEYAETLEEAWKEDQLHAAEREREKKDKRVYGHWKFFIKAMLAKERVKRKYAYLGTMSTEKGSADQNNNTESSAAWQAKRIEVARRMSKHMKRRKLPIGNQKEELFPF